MKKKSNFPNFYIVGAPKAGTSSLHSYLSQHPEIFMSAKKEPHFHAYKGDIPIYKGPKDYESCQSMMVKSFDEYMSLFNLVGNEKIIGESSAMYLDIESSVESIYKMNPDSKILIVLRNPVDRAISAYNHLIRDKRESLEFSEAIAVENERLRNGYMPFWGYLKQSAYYNNVKNYLDVFGEKNVKIILYENLKLNLNNELNSITKFLNVNDFTFDTSYKENISGVPKVRFLHEFLRNPPKFSKYFYSIFPSNFRKRIKSYIYISNLNKNKAIDKDLIEMLARNFSKDIDYLEMLVPGVKETWKQ